MSILASLKALPLVALLLFGEPFTFEFSSQTGPDGEAYVVVVANEAGEFDLEITGNDGSKITQRLKLKAGSKKKITWKQKGKSVDYSMVITGEDTETSFTFSVAGAAASGKLAPLELKSDRSDIVDRHKVRYHTPFTITSYKLEVYDTEGNVIVDKLVTDKTIPANSDFELTWDSPEDVFMVYVKAEDDVGRFAEDRRVPWSAEIPHTDVIFDSGQSVIKPGESPKVDEAFAVLVHELDAIERANKAVNGDIKVSLYVVGYTDTVGKPGDNEKLSRDRARAIAQYFKDKGTWCEIYYAGMGERGQAVKTDDNVDEARNRRATYILSPQPQKPSGASMPNPGAWKLLSGESPRMMMSLPALPQSYVDYKEKQREEREKKFGKGGGSSSSGGGTSTDGGTSSDSSGGAVHPRPRRARRAAASMLRPTSRRISAASP
jgi:outer membrane protein OmpA-like peptidoglycan-associated protein